MIDPFSGVFTIPRMAFFFAGMGASCVLNWYRARHRGEKINWRIVGIFAAVAAMVFIAMQVVSLSSQTQICQQELIAALEANKQIADTNDELSEQQRKLLLQDNIELGNWINTLIHPPMPRDEHPAYDNWSLKVTQDWYSRTSVIRDQLNRLQEKVDYNQEQRTKHPLPKPKCGVK